MRKLIGIGMFAVLGGAAIAFAQTDHSGLAAMMDHAAQDPTGLPADAVLTEPGQGAFAALSEVVRYLEARPETDWSRVDLSSLRAHLVDMDRLVSDTEVKDERLPNGILSKATGEPETVATLRRMVPAHAAQLAMDGRWVVTTYETDNGVALQVTSEEPDVVSRIQGLGFFGLMASQDHHREHHLMMALGEGAHGQ